MINKNNFWFIRKFLIENFCEISNNTNKSCLRNLYIEFWNKWMYYWKKRGWWPLLWGTYIDSAFNYHKSLMYQAFPSGIDVSFEQDLKFLRCAFFILLLWSIFRTCKSNIFHNTKSDISVTFKILHFHQTQKKQSFLKNGQKISTTTITDG